MSESKRCLFMKCWVGRCKDEPIEPYDMCEKHRVLTCSSCGEPATHDCAETMGPMVCGAPLCDDCEHTTQSNGCNSGGELPLNLKNHCKKSEQVYTPWYEREAP